MDTFGNVILLGLELGAISGTRPFLQIYCRPSACASRKSNQAYNILCFVSFDAHSREPYIDQIADAWASFGQSTWILLQAFAIMSSRASSSYDILFFQLN